MAAIELKKKNWKFNKKFVTWFKKADGAPENGPLPAVGSLGKRDSVSTCDSNIFLTTNTFCLS
tara:strand:- start:657 stop:845 length:189 start_codon:yes stop_codon:yes gene_type:complete